MFKIKMDKALNLQIIGLFIAIAIAYHPTLSQLMSRWTQWDQALSHALPTVAVTGYFLWQIKFFPSSQDNHWIKAGLYLFLGLLSVAWAGFQVSNIEILSAFSLFLIILVYIASCFSIVTTLKTLPIFSLLLFTLPILQQLNGLLVWISTFMTTKLVAASNITALIEGNSISIPSGKIIIADGCSGLRYLTISVLLGYIICLLNKSHWKQNFWIILASILIGLFANWLRIFLLILIGYHTQMQSSLMQDHETFGWILFTLIIAPALYFAPVNKNLGYSIPAPKLQFFIPTLILVIGPLLLFCSNASYESTFNPLKLSTFNAYISATARNTSAINEAIQGAHETSTLEINETIILSTLLTNTANNHNKLVPYIEQPYNKESWKILHSIDANPNNFEYLVIKGASSNQKRIFAYSFQVGSSSTKKYFIAKLFQLKAKLLNEAYFGLITLESDCESDCKQEAQSISELATQWNSTLK